jgi:uncharacterized FAD-dependent dehydrogenase
MIEVSNVRLPLDAGLPGGEALARSSIANVLGVKAAEIGELQLLKRSVDARKKNDIGFVATFAVELLDGEVERDILDGSVSVSKKVTVKLHVPYEPLDIPKVTPSANAPRPVVVGTGPAGLFAALYLARSGLSPLVIERGGDVDERLAAIEAFNTGANLDVSTNVQFGEGGAGTFSDGKLNTGIKDARCRFVLEELAKAGDCPDILWQAKPHVGTDVLLTVVQNIRQRIISLGGEVRFRSQVTGIRQENGWLTGLEVNGEWIDCDRAVLAIGHSARDTFEMLLANGITMEPKPFSMGVRIEHLQKNIDQAQYGKHDPVLPPAD